MSFLRQGRTSNKTFCQNVYATSAHNTNFQKHFKPVTDMQKDLKEDLVRELKPVREGIKNSPTAITLPQFPSITAYDDDDVAEEDVFIDDIAEQFLRKFATMSGADKTCGLRDKHGKFYIGNKEAKIK